MKSGWTHTLIDDAAKTPQTQTFHALGTSIVLTVYGTTSADILTASQQLVDQYEDQLTVNRVDSEVMAINHAAGETAIQVSDSTFSLVKLALTASLEDSGFNAAIGPLVKQWQIGFAGAHVPSKESIQAAMTLIDPHKIVLDEEQHSVLLQEAGMELDLGAIAKGYIADRIRDLWRAHGVISGIINLGGNLLFVGDAPARVDKMWRIGVQDPWAQRGAPLATVILPECSAVTSGIYERHLDVDGQAYHHIIDSRTGYPFETRLESVTIFSRHSVIGEIESTRLFFDQAADEQWLVAHPDCYGAVFVSQDHKLTSVGFKQQVDGSLILASNEV
ncbi:FAD:protein FMN transferase [Furfurilactobacillus siliginis]|nr:FAD:protein FMN transferase [Furfurilactobacillus siliginis]GEK27985.1 FAD:protein FMN transferase [Furfurilactobacillus siliginis]